MRVFKSEIIFLVILVILSICVVFWIYPGFSQIGTDGVIYALVGQNIAEGNGISLYGQPHTVFPILLPFFIALFFKISGNLELSAHLATIFFAIASIPVFYLLVRDMFSRQVAFVSAILFAFSGQLIWQYTTMPTPQFLIGFLSILIFWLLFKISYQNKLSSNKRAVLMLLLGLLIGFAYLARSEYFLLILPVLIYVFFIYKKQFAYTITYKSLAIIIIGFLIVSLPYLIFLHNSLGYWTISGKLGGATLGLIQGDHDLEVKAGDSFTTAVNISDEIEGSVAKKVVQKIPSLLKEFFKSLRDAERYLVTTLGFIGIIWIAFGLFDLMRKKKWKILWIMAISISLLPVVVFVVSNIPNYIMPYFFLFVILMGIGLNYFVDELKNLFAGVKTRSTLILTILVAVTSFYLFLPVLQGYFFLPKDFQPLELKEMGLWMKHNIPNIEQEIVLSRKPDINFYSGSMFEIIPNVENVDTLIDFMNKRDIKYLVVDNRYMLNSREQFAGLLENPHPGLELEHKTVFQGKQAILYKLK